MNRETRWLVALSGALVGALIGPIGFLLGIAPAGLEFPGPVNRWARNLGSLATLGPARVFAIVAFLATLLLMPVFLRWLEARLDRTLGRFYRAAAIGGIVFGFVATILTTWGLFIALIFAPPVAGSPPEPAPIGVLLTGAAVFGPIAGLTMAVMFLPVIAIAGVGFGAAYGAVVRRLVQRRNP